MPPMLRARFAIPGSCIFPDIDKGIQLTKIPSQDLIKYGFWTADYWADAVGKTGNRDKTIIVEGEYVYLLQVRFTQDDPRCGKITSKDGELLDPACDSTAYNLKKELLKATGDPTILNMIVIGNDDIKTKYEDMIKAFKDQAKILSNKEDSKLLKDTQYQQSQPVECFNPSFNVSHDTKDLTKELTNQAQKRITPTKVYRSIWDFSTEPHSSEDDDDEERVKRKELEDKVKKEELSWHNVRVWRRRHAMAVDQEARSATGSRKPKY